MNTATLDSVLHWLLRTSLEASVLILAVLGLRVILGNRLSPAWRIGLWMVVGLKLLLPACIPAGFGLGHWWAGESQPPSAMVAPVSMPDAAATVEVGRALPAENIPVRDESAVSDISPSWWCSLWLAGALTLLAAAVSRQRRFERRLSQRPPARDPHLLGMVRRLSRLAGVRQEVQVIMMPAGTTPAVVGCRRARLLLPEDWDSRFDDASLRHVLLHELLHVRQGDLWWNWAALALQAVHWFNPLVWFVVARFQADRELRCDAGALALLAPNERLAYGHTLLRIQETFFAPPAIAGLAPCVRNHPTLRQRITMIAQPARNRPWLQSLFAIAFGLITCYAFTTVGAAEEEKAVPAKDRSREGARSGTPSKEAAPGEREGDGKMKTGEREGDKPRTGERDGDKPRTGERDGMRKKTGEGDGAPRKGPRDGETKKTGERDGERPKTGEREGEGRPSKEGAAVKSKTTGSGEAIAMHVTKGGEAIVIAGEEVPAGRLRGYLHNLLAGQESPQATISADGDVSFEALAKVIDAVRDNGIKNPAVRSNAKE